MTAKEQNIVV